VIWKSPRHDREVRGDVLQEELTIPIAADKMKAATGGK